MSLTSSAYGTLSKEQENIVLERKDELFKKIEKNYCAEINYNVVAYYRKLKKLKGMDLLEEVMKRDGPLCMNAIVHLIRELPVIEDELNKFAISLTITTEKTECIGYMLDYKNEASMLRVLNKVLKDHPLIACGIYRTYMIEMAKQKKPQLTLNAFNKIMGKFIENNPNHLLCVCVAALESKIVLFNDENRKFLSEDKLIFLHPDKLGKEGVAVCAVLYFLIKSEDRIESGNHNETNQVLSELVNKCARFGLKSHSPILFRKYVDIILASKIHPSKKFNNLFNIFVFNQLLFKSGKAKIFGKFEELKLFFYMMKKAVENNCGSVAENLFLCFKRARPQLPLLLENSSNGAVLKIEPAKTALYARTVVEFHQYIKNLIELGKNHIYIPLPVWESVYMDRRQQEELHQHMKNFIERGESVSVDIIIHCEKTSFVKRQQNKEKLTICKKALYDVINAYPGATLVKGERSNELKLILEKRFFENEKKGYYERVMGTSMIEIYGRFDETRDRNELELHPIDFDPYGYADIERRLDYILEENKFAHSYQRPLELQEARWNSIRMQENPVEFREEEEFNSLVREIIDSIGGSQQPSTPLPPFFHF